MTDDPSPEDDSYDPWQDDTRPEYWDALWESIDWHRCAAWYWELGIDLDD